MGAKLTKTKSLFISGDTKQQQQHAHLPTMVDNTNNQLDLTVNDDPKQVANNKNKKTKEVKSKKKSSKAKLDKSTNTENCVLPSSSFVEQLVGEKVIPQSDQVCSDTDTIPANVNEVQELRDACLQNDIISAESFNNKPQELNEDSGQEINSNNVEEVTNTISNVGSVYYKEQIQEQKHSVES